MTFWLYPKNLINSSVLKQIVSLGFIPKNCSCIMKLCPFTPPIWMVSLPLRFLIFILSTYLLPFLWEYPDTHFQGVSSQFSETHQGIYAIAASSLQVITPQPQPESTRMNPSSAREITCFLPSKLRSVTLIYALPSAS